VHTDMDEWTEIRRKVLVEGVFRHARVRQIVRQTKSLASRPAPGGLDTSPTRLFDHWRPGGARHDARAHRL